LTARYAVIGEPVAHSLSPAMLNAAFVSLGMDATYEAVEVRPDELAEFVQRARNGAFAGFNVTTPHKEAIITALDALTEEARLAQAVNVVRSAANALTGHNTDGSGFVAALADIWGWQPKGAAVLLLGSGPAARAIAISLVKAGAVHVACWSRNDETARKIGPPPRRPADLVVSTLPASAVVPDRVLEFVSPQTLVFDANYNASRATVPLALGKAHTDGLPLLLHQGGLSFEWWLNMPAPLDVMRAAIGCGD